MMWRPATLSASKTSSASSLLLERQEERQTDVIFTNLTDALLSTVEDGSLISTNHTTITLILL